MIWLLLIISIIIGCVFYISKYKRPTILRWTPIQTRIKTLSERKHEKAKAFDKKEIKERWKVPSVTTQQQSHQPTRIPSDGAIIASPNGADSQVEDIGARNIALTQVLEPEIPNHPFLPKATGKFMLQSQTTIQLINDYLYTVPPHKIPGKGSTISTRNGFSIEIPDKKLENLLLEVARLIQATPSTPWIPRILASQYIINTTRFNAEIYHQLDFCFKTVGDRTIPEQIRANAYDVIIQANSSKYPAKVAREMMGAIDDDLERAELRQERPQRRMRQPRQENIGAIAHQELQDLERAIQLSLKPKKKTRPKTVYQDRQNVHNDEINKTVLLNLKKKMDAGTLSPTGSVTLGSMFITIPLSETQRIKAQESLDRIMVDSFKVHGNITLRTTLQSTLDFMNGHPNREDIEKRLLEELVEMKGLCATGHMSRLVNVTQGFADKDGSMTHTIKMNPKDELYAKLSNFIQKKAGEDDQLMEMIMDPKDAKEFSEKVHDVALKGGLYEELVREYSTIGLGDAEVKDMYVESVKKYTGY